MNQLTDDLIAAYAELRRFLLRRLGNPDDAADVAQSSFERVYAHALASPIASPRALLFRTARNICIDEARHRAVARAWAEERANLDADSSAASAEEVAAHRQLVERVAERLAQLPARRREVFLLYRAFGHSRQAIAQRLGITESAVAKHLVRATLDCARCCADLRSD